MNTSVQARRFGADTLTLSGRESTAGRAKVADRAASYEAPSSLFFILWLGFGALLSVGWAVTLVLLASYVLGLL